MARLPIPGQDAGTWGEILNEYLAQSLKSDGTIKDNAVTANNIAPNSITNTQIASDTITAAVIQDGSITEALLDPAVQIKLNTPAGAPDWSAVTNKPIVIAAGADQATARTAIGAGTSNLALAGTGVATTAAKSDHTQTASTISDSTTIGRVILTAADATAVKTSLSLTKADIGLGSVDNTSDATKNSASATLTNKTLDNSTTATLKDNSFTLQDNGDSSKQLQFDLASITVSTTRTLTVPDANTTLVGTDATQTLTNKTISGSSNTITNVPTAALPYSGAVTAYYNGILTTTSTTGATHANGPAATVTIGASGMCMVVIGCTWASINPANNSAHMSFQLTGANTIGYGAGINADTLTNNLQVVPTSGTYLLTGLSTGSTTFTTMYYVVGGTGSYAVPRITVIPL